MSYVNIIVTTVTIVTIEAQKTNLVLSMGFIVNTFRLEHFIEILGHVIGKLIRLYSLDMHFCKQFRCRSLPVSDTFDILCRFPQVIRHSLDFPFFCGFLIF